jgi:ribosomal protein L13E
VELLGVLARQEAVADHRILAHAHEAAGLANPTALGDVRQDRHHLLLGQAGVEQGRAFALGETGFAGLAIEQAALLGVQ